MDSTQFRAAAHSAIEEIISYYDNIRTREVLPNVEPGYLRPMLQMESVPEKGESWENIQKDIETKIMPGITHWQSPNFLAFFPANSSYPGMLGELYSSAFTCAAFNWQCSPVVTELETIVLDNLAKFLNLPECYLSSGEGGGVIQGTASEAIVTVLVVARDRYIQQSKEAWKKEGCDDEEIDRRVCDLRGRLVALGSDQTHSSTQKAAKIAGVQFDTIPTRTKDYSLRGDQLSAKLKELTDKGLKPFYLTVTYGTTSTCAVDDYPSIITSLEEHYASNPSDHEIWVHVDAAYAGSALVLPENQHLTHHFEKFDSFDVNMHKWMLTNFDCSCLFVKRRKHLVDALSVTPSYLRNQYSESGLVTDYRDWQIPLGRRFRAMKVWFVMRSFGQEGIRSHIQRSCDNGLRFASHIKSRPELFEITVDPVFALTVFTVKYPGSNDREKANEITKKVYETVNAERKIFITSTTLGHGDEQLYAIRVNCGVPSIRGEDMDHAYDVILEVAERVWKECGGNPN